MKKYVIKKTYTATRDSKYFEKGCQEIYYLGKRGDYSHKELCDYVIENAYVKKLYAEKYIEEDKAFVEKYDGDFWQVDYEIIEIEL